MCYSVNLIPWMVETFKCQNLFQSRLIVTHMPLVDLLLNMYTFELNYVKVFNHSLKVSL